MNRLLLLVVAVAVLLFGAGLLILGAFPPELAQHPVQTVIPNDHFQTH